MKIQRVILWGGATGGRKISWVKWKTICQPKCNGGMGVRDIRVVNLSLLAKWRWRMLQDEDDIWKDTLVAKYDPNVTNLMEGGWGLRLVTLPCG